jgi:hypothetical protein
MAMRQFEQGMEMIFVSMYPTGAKQSHQMQCRIVLFHVFDSLKQSWIREKITISDRFTNPGQFLIDHKASADIEMTNFRVTNLPGW